MIKQLGKILPIDRYRVRLKEQVASDYTISLTHLYQPLVGMEAVILYQTLLNETTLQLEPFEQTHHTLMNYINIPLDQIYDARLKLEGIGLLHTYVEEDDQKRQFTYELSSPFSPQHFFQDGMLSELLFHHIGRQKWLTLKKQFVTHDQIKGKDITASFQEVFQTFQPTYERYPIEKKAEHQLNQYKTNLDYSWLKQMLKQKMIPVRKVLSEENKTLIAQMSILYELEMYELEKAVLWALTEENSLDQEEFKEACHDLFKSKYNETSIQLSTRTVDQKSVKNEKTASTLSKEEQLIQALEHLSPKQLLEDLSNGNHATEQDMRIIREVMTKQGLPSAVMNVLIHYVLLRSDMKLSKPYMEKIAGHWSRANLKTAREAMEFAKKESARRSTYKHTNQRQYPYKSPRSKETLPDWFKERKKKIVSPNSKGTKTKDENENKEEEVLALLQKHIQPNQTYKG